MTKTRFLSLTLFLLENLLLNTTLSYNICQQNVIIVFPSSWYMIANGSTTIKLIANGSTTIKLSFHQRDDKWIFNELGFVTRLLFLCTICNDAHSFLGWLHYGDLRRQSRLGVGEVAATERVVLNTF